MAIFIKPIFINPGNFIYYKLLNKIKDLKIILYKYKI